MDERSWYKKLSWKGHTMKSETKQKPSVSVGFGSSYTLKDWDSSLLQAFCHQILWIESWVSSVKKRTKNSAFNGLMAQPKKFISIKWKVLEEYHFFYNLFFP